MSWAAWSGHHAPLQAQVQAVMDPEGQLAAQLLQFLNTRDGLAWLSGTLDAWEAALSRGPPSFQDLNTLVITKLLLLLPILLLLLPILLPLLPILLLLLPILLLLLPILLLLSLWVTMELLWAKLLLKGAARKRGRRTYSTLCFITDIALPTSFYGPALGTPERSEEDKVHPPGLQACYQHPLRPPTPDQDIVKRLSLSALKCGICHKQAVCGCPICGVTTNMVTPSKTWPKSPADKAAIVTAYHNKLANIDCKEFRGGEGNCRFGSRCLYRHKCKATRPPRATAGAGQAQRAGRAARAVAVDPPQRQRQPKSASGDRGG
ncbi:C3H1-type domain-containing protein, partial [Haematococcus lacustris]